MGHIKLFSVDNFRVFGKPTDFELSPITILTGTNSSGKSSLINAIKILAEYALVSKEKMAFPYTLFEKETKNPFGKAINLANNKVSPISESIRFKLGYTNSNVLFDFTFSVDLKTNNISLVEMILQNNISQSKIVTVTNSKNCLQTILCYKSHFENIYNRYINSKESNLYSHDEFNLIDDIYLYDCTGFMKVIISDEYLDEYPFDKWKVEFKKRKWIEIEEGKNFELIDKLRTHNTKLNEILPLSNVTIKILEDALNNAFFDLLPQEGKSDSNIQGAFFDGIANCFIDFPLTDEVETHNNIDKIKYIDLNVDTSISQLMNNDSLNMHSLKSTLVTLVVSEIISNYTFTKKSESFFKCLANNVKEELESFTHLANVTSISNKLSLNSRVLVGDNEYHDLIISFFNSNWYNSRSIKEFLIDQLIAFNIGNDIIIIRGDEGVTTNVKVKKGNEEIYLSDLGFGVSKVLPIILKICTLAALNIQDLGSLEVDKEDFTSSILLIEEPEANLHPALQSKLADMFFEAFKKFNMQLIIETHSEYLIRKFQYLTASNKSELQPEDSVLYYFYNPESIPRGESQVKKINISEDGTLSDDFGTGFFDEADKIAMELFLLNRNQKN